VRHLSDIDFYRSPVVSDMKVAQKKFVSFIFKQRKKNILYLRTEKKIIRE